MDFEDHYKRLEVEQRAEVTACHQDRDRRVVTAIQDITAAIADRVKEYPPDRCHWVLIEEVQHVSWEIFVVHNSDWVSRGVNLLPDGRLIRVRRECCEPLRSVGYFDPASDDTQYHADTSLRSVDTLNRTYKGLIELAEPFFGVQLQTQWLEADKIL